MKDVIAPIAVAFGDALEPLLDAFRDVDGFLALADELGYALDADEALDDFFDPDGPFGPFAAAAADVSTAIESAVNLANQLRDDPASFDVTEIFNLIDSFRGVITQVVALRAPTNATLPPLLDVPELWDTLTEELPEFLLAEYLASHQPLIYGLLEVLGIARRIQVEPDAQLLRQPYVRRDVRWDYLGDLFSDPGGHLQQVFSWNGLAKPDDDLTGFDYERVFSAFAALAAACRVQLVQRPMSDTIYLEHYPAPHASLGARPSEIALDLVKGRDPTTGASVRLGLISAPVPEVGEDTPSGLLLTNITEGRIVAGTELAPGWTLNAGGSASASHAFTLSILPSGVTAASSLPSLPDVTVTLAGSPANDSGLWTLLGSAEGTGLTLRGIDISLSFGDSPNGPDLTASVALADVQFAMRAGEADNLINSLLSAIDIAIAVSLQAAYSTQSGFSFIATGGTLGGPDGFTLEFPVDINLGPFSVTGLQVTIAPVNGNISAAGTTTLLAEIGPFAATVSEMGIALELVRVQSGEGQIGPFDLDVRFKSPSRLALAIESEAITGGGFLEISETRYAGALMVQAVSVGIAAITVIDTELPDDPEGWSFFAALSLEFPAIPLGFGFTLSGLGGLIALHRGCDEIALAVGLKAGAVDSLLFPDDPINDAAAIIAHMDDYFPPLPGNTVVGPMVQIGWGMPKTLLTAELGVIISLPEGKIGLLGTVAVLLPDPTAPLLSLRMDILGAINVPDGTMFMLASLYDSTLLGTIHLSGDMGTFLSVAVQPYFLFSVGGYNPGFQPPALVPAPLQDLRRMQASIEIGDTVDIRITNYFALTSNTVQFGSEVVLEASVEIWPVTYTARGELGFHVFLRFSPFLISADFEASVGVYAGDKELMGVHLGAHLEGPEPWYASGYASFRFFGKDVEFEFEVGSQLPGQSKPRIPVRNDVLLALEDRANWREAAPTAQLPSALTYLDDNTADDDRLWIRPDYTIEVRQGAAPLNRSIEVVGQALPETGHERIEITGAGLGNAADGYEIAQDWFAPAQFEKLGKNEKLTRASYETMDAGVRFASPELSTTAFEAELGRTAEVGYEEALYDPDDGPLVFEHPAGSLAHAARAGSAGLAMRRQKPARQGGEFQIADTQWTLVNETTGVQEASVLAQGGVDIAGDSQHAVLSAAGAQTGLRAVPVTTITEAS